MSKTRSGKTTSSRPATRHLFRSVPWVMLEAGFNICHGLASIFAIGWLIAPSELGRASVALSTVLFIESFTSLGLQEAVIRARSGETLTTDTAFSLAILSGCCGVLLAGGAAVPLGYAYGSYEITALLFAAATIIPLNALLAVPAAMLARKVRGAALTKRMILGKLLGLTVLLLSGVFGTGAWAVVLSSIATSAGGLLVLALLTKRFPKFRFDKARARELLGFGILQGLENVFWSATYRLFGVLLGYLHGAAALGYFYFALRLVEEIAGMLQLIVSRFALSLFAGLQRAASVDATVSAFIKGTRVLTLVASPAFALLALFSGDVLAILFGQQWDASAPLIAILSIGWIFAFPRILVAPMLRARGDQRLVLYYAGASCGFTLLACLASSGLPLSAIAIAWTARHVIAVPWSVWVVHYRYGLSYRSLADLAVRPLIAITAMSAMVVAVDRLLPALPPWSHIAVGATLGVAVYACVALIMDRESVKIIRHIANSAVRRNVL
ncbi:oligosaccharide flippase family protein [Bradyrhizobium sp. 25ACV]